MTQGIQCPKCSGTDIGVAQTVRLDNAVLRYRKCRNCHQRFKTYELQADVIPSTPAFDFLFQKVPT